MIPAALAAALCGYRLGLENLWSDEALTYTFATQPLHEFIATLAQGEANMTGYYLFMRAWVLLGDSESWLRLPSLLAVAGACALTVMLGRRLHSLTAGFLGGVLLAAHPIMFAYGREARSYGFLAAAAVLTTSALLWTLDRPTPRRALTYGVLAAAGMWIHLLFVLVLAAHVGVAISQVNRGSNRRAIGRAAIVAALPIVLLGSGPLIVVGVVGRSLDWIPDPTPLLLVDRVTTLLGGAGLALIVAIVAVAALARWSQPAVPPLLISLGVPIAVLAAVSVVKPLFVVRYLIVVLPAASLLLGVAIAALSRRVPAAIALAVVVVMIGVPRVADGYQPRRDEWRAATEWMSTRAEPGDQFVLVYNRDAHGNQVFPAYWQRFDGPPLTMVSSQRPGDIVPARVWVVFNGGPWLYGKPVLDRAWSFGRIKLEYHVRGIDLWLFEPRA